jgi:hypothetical protein
LKVGWVIIERFMRAKGGGRASVRFLQQATGLSGRIVVQACNELVDWGYCSRMIGIGTRPTEYVPSWATVSPMCSAKPVDASVSQECNASASPMCNANDDSASPMCSEYLLTVPADKPMYRKAGVNDFAAPAGGGLSASAEAAPEAAKEDGFEQLWRAYDFPGDDKDKARAAYRRLCPDAALQAKLTESANAWCESWKAQNNPEAPRKYLYKWLAEKCFEKDAPGKRVAANRNSQPKGRRVAEIIDSDAVAHGSGDALVIYFRDVGNGKKFDDRFTVDKDGNVIGADRATFEKLCAAIDVTPNAGASAFIGEIVEVDFVKGQPRYFEHVPRYEAA